MGRCPAYLIYSKRQACKNKKSWRPLYIEIGAEGAETPENIYRIGAEGAETLENAYRIGAEGAETLENTYRIGAEGAETLGNTYIIGAEGAETPEHTHKIGADGYSPSASCSKTKKNKKLRVPWWGVGIICFLLKIRN